jgi:hypothetical protein
MFAMIDKNQTQPVRVHPEGKSTGIVLRFSWTSWCEAGRRARADNWKDKLPIHDIWLIRCSDGFLKEYPDALSGIQVSAHRDQLHRRFLCTHGSREHEPGGVIPSVDDIGISGVKYPGMLRIRHCWLAGVLHATPEIPAYLPQAPPIVFSGKHDRQERCNLAIPLIPEPGTI